MRKAACRNALAGPLICLAALAAVCFGALVEALQPLTGRSAKMLDLAADALGSVVGAAAAAVVAWSGERAAGNRTAGKRGDPR